MLQVYKNIKKRRNELGMTQTELAKKMGYADKSMIAKIEKGLIDLPQSKVLAFAEALQSQPGDLMGLDGAQDSLKAAIAGISNIMPLPYEEGKTVPLLGTIACGTPILAVENVERQILLPDSLSADFCLRCKGDSMINARIYNGDIVYIKQQATVENGEIAAVLIADTADVSEATLKRVYIYEDKIMLVAENPQYEPLVYVGGEMNSVRIIGKAVSLMGRVK